MVDVAGSLFCLFYLVLRKIDTYFAHHDARRFNNLDRMEFLLEGVRIVVGKTKPIVIGMEF